MARPDISVIIPVYNRGTLVRHTLDSVKVAASGLDVETIVVDDGSDIPLAEELGPRRSEVTKLVRQERGGLLRARLTGLANVSGKNVMFLDSDDLVSTDKLRSHVEALDSADVSYSDMARQRIDAVDGPLGAAVPEPELPKDLGSAEFFLKTQPAPHSPAFRMEYLQERVRMAPFPPSPLFNPVAEIWFYHICAPFPARVIKSDGLAIVGFHDAERLTGSWERLGLASLAVQEAFARSCPDTIEGKHARRLFSAKAFREWRRLPYDFSPKFSARLLSLFESSVERLDASEIGGPLFGLVATMTGPIAAGRFFRRIRGKSYNASRTLDDESFERELAKLPSP